MPLEFETPGADKWVRMMLYAYPGWGKTSLESTFAELGPMLLIRSSVDQIPARLLKYKKEIKVVTCDTHEKLDEILDYCRMTRNFPFKWVWWDNVSTAQDKLLDDVWEAVIAEKPQRNWVMSQQGKRLRPNLTPSSGLDRGEYGRNAERIQQWVRHMVGIRRFHFGIGAHPAEMDHPVNDEGGTILAPWIQVKNMTSKICGYMNVVSFLELYEDDDGENVRKLHVRENERFYAKDLYDAFPKGFVINPTGPKVMTAIQKAFGAPMGVSTTGNGRAAVPARRGRGRAAA